MCTVITNVAIYGVFCYKLKNKYRNLFQQLHENSNNE